jgi:hypothetical protein
LVLNELIVVSQMLKTRLRPVFSGGSKLWTRWWLIEVVESDCMEDGGSVVVFVIVAKGAVEVNRPSGRNVNNFIAIALRRDSNTKRGENLHRVGFLW